MFEPGIRYVAERHIVVDNQPVVAPFWEPPQDYVDKTVVIFGGGPSHSEIETDEVDFSSCGIFAVNSSCRFVKQFAKEIDILYFSDNSWGLRYLDLIQSWPGRCVTSNRNFKAKFGDLIHRIDLFDLTSWFGIKSDCVHASSAHTAAVLAVKMGAKRLVLIGMECKEINGQTHGHKDYMQRNLNVFTERFIPGWEGLKLGFERFNIEVINSTPDSAITCFPYLNFKDAVDV